MFRQVLKDLLVSWAKIGVRGILKDSPSPGRRRLRHGDECGQQQEADDDGAAYAADDDERQQKQLQRRFGAEGMPTGARVEETPPLRVVDVGSALSGPGSTSGYR